MSAEPDATDSGTRTRLHLLVDEAQRQLAICNACRYCEGLCAVFPALERRSLITSGDISQLANLCHDCRACYDSCMYTAPHEFALNIPVVLAEVRLDDYQRYVWPRRVPKILRGWSGVFCGSLMATVTVFVIALINLGVSRLIEGGTGAKSPYGVIPEPVLLAIVLLPALFSVAVLACAGRAYWTATARLPRGPLLPAVMRAFRDAITLRYMRGGGAECFYPDADTPSPLRRRLHGLVVYGFGLCFVSTVLAAFLQHIMGSNPPYPVLSAPVISGILGGIGLVIGCTGLLLLKARASAVLSVRQMTIKDYGLLTSLEFLALTGFATLVSRDTAAFDLIFIVHLAAVAAAFAAVPYSKFTHLIYRFLALVRDEGEAAGAKSEGRMLQRRPQIQPCGSVACGWGSGRVLGLRACWSS